MKLSSVIKTENADLEKQANRLNKLTALHKKFIITGILCLGALFTYAQPNEEFASGKFYILGGVEVTGKVNYQEQTVVTFSGLEKGDRIQVPGEEVSNAIKKLWGLGLFSDINFYVNNIKGDSIFLRLHLNELPKLSDVRIEGIKKSKGETIIKDANLTKGKIVNENLITTTKNYIENKYRKEGYYRTKVIISTAPDTIENQVKMLVNIDKGSKTRISSIDFEGNSVYSDGQLRRTMKKTKEKSLLRMFRFDLRSSKYIREEYKNDLVSIIDKYKENGYRDARVVSDTIVYNPEKDRLSFNIKVEEGNKYYFGDIKFLGNSVYPDDLLRRILGITKGDEYNGILLQRRIEDNTKPDPEDLTSLYHNNGYLFSRINAVETRTVNDTIDFEIRITEGPIAYFNNITVVGNEKTNDKVIYRELRTRPGQKWNKELVVRTVRELGQLGFFDAETIRPEVKNPDPISGTVDVEWNVVERGASQIQLQGGYGGGGFIGTLALSFNNFSIGSLFDKEAYKPLPMGDGQSLALRLQGGSYFQTYSLSFTEPWLGGKKPIQFTGSVSYSKQYMFNWYNRDVDRSQGFNIISIYLGLGKRLTVPDDDFYLRQGIGYQHYDINNYRIGLFSFENGFARNLSYTVGFSRNNKGHNPIFPTTGAEIGVTGKFTFPYSLVNGVDYANLKNQEEYKLKYNDRGVQDYQVNENDERPLNGDYVKIVSTDSNGNHTYEKVYAYQDASPDQAKIDQKRFNWLEYYKIKFNVDAYTQLRGKFVLRSAAEFGYLGAYNNDRGMVPFERFFVGGDGLANFSLDGREMIQMRGYPNNSLTDPNEGGTIYNKFSLELRYPITMKPMASIYGLAFLEAGAAYNNFKDYNPFQLKRSAGMGLRVFMPAFGLLGIDFAHGFDPIYGGTRKNGWETHFIIGQQF
ncbi:MAG: POTRA domain-containing protein [Flavobacteriaceae bacterium]